ncbi:MAG: YgjP-like metallopeptidase domain-containing protein, partial [Caldimonas sp.]
MTSPLRRGLRRIVDALQLDLFDAIDAPDPAVPRSSPRPTAIDPATGSEPPPAGGLLRHPLATREALLDGRVVAYRLVRIRRRSIGFVVDSHGLAVRAASRVSLREIDAAVHEKRAWIVARLAEQGERAARAAAARVVWRDGAAIDYLGEKLIVVLDPER